ncbi:MAG TPA: alpha/beta hydrolase [Thermoleophilaceae bacterium]|nr:alpha/beta hydrolase [Thermoleophilaceae bacterium]
MTPQLPELEGVEHRYEQVGELRMHYAEAGDPAADTLLLVHGWPQNWWAWRRLIGPLAERFHVIAPDLRGLGWTDAGPGPYDKGTLARDVVNLMDVLGIERARWLGHDWGAFGGWHVVTESPERFERFMPLSVPHPWPPEKNDPRRLLRAWYQVVLGAPGLGQLAHGPIHFPRKILERARVAGEWGDDELDFYEELLRRDGYREASMLYYRTFVTRELPALARGQFADRRLTVPTRLVVGTKDQVAQMGDEYRNHADDMEIVKVEGAGHWLPEEKPDAVLEIALAFLP